MSPEDSGAADISLQSNGKWSIEQGTEEQVSSLRFSLGHWDPGQYGPKPLP